MTSKLRAPVAFLGCAVLASCSATSSGLPRPAAADDFRHLSSTGSVSAEVDIQDGWTHKIVGSGSADCWSISPPLPKLGPDGSAGPITLTYTASTSCGLPSGIAIVYRPVGARREKCTFNVEYTASGFSFSATQTQKTDCTIEYPPFSIINAILIYKQKT